LVFEDDSHELDQLIAHFSETDQPPIQVQYTDSLEAGLEWLTEKRTDVILLKFPLEGYEGMLPLRKLRQVVPYLPIVLMVNLDDEFHALEGLKKGAQEYIIQGQFTTQGLVRTLRTAMIRKDTARQRERLLNRPFEAHHLGHVVVLRPPVLFCIWCHHVRIHKGQWIPLEAYLKENRDRPINHGLSPGACPGCTRIIHEAARRRNPER
jgi:DNA-binding response OmpR family regulator